MIPTLLSGGSAHRFHHHGDMCDRSSGYWPAEVVGNLFNGCTVKIGVANLTPSFSLSAQDRFIDLAQVHPLGTPSGFSTMSTGVPSSRKGMSSARTILATIPLFRGVRPSYHPLSAYALQQVYFGQFQHAAGSSSRWNINFLLF